MKWRETEKMRLDILIAEEQRKCQVFCPTCGWKNHVYSFQNGRVICKNCRNFVYKNDKTKFKYKVKEELNKCKYSN